MNQKLLGIVGILVILDIAFALSTNRRAIRVRVVGAAGEMEAAHPLECDDGAGPQREGGRADGIV